MSIHYSTVIEVGVTMRIPQFSLLIFCLLILNCHALNCRSDGGPKEMELKKIYNVCIKQQDGSDKNNGPDDTDRDWREKGGHHQWSQDNMARNKDDNNDNKMGNRDSQNGENRDRFGDKNKLRGQNRNNNSRDKKRDENEGTHKRDRGEDGQSRSDNNRHEKTYGLSNRNDFFPNEDYSGSNNQYANQPSRRYKRERRVEMNSGKRSQYNPNPQRFSGYEGRYGSEENNSSENFNKYNGKKACALHCLLENLHMTGQNGMPDRYFVTHVITTNIKDEDLKDFLQESIDECFQLLDNENIEDKCEFSKNLLMCLSEKGRSNCDDWKDDFQF